MSSVADAIAGQERCCVVRFNLAIPQAMPDDFGEPSRLAGRSETGIDSRVACESCEDDLQPLGGGKRSAFHDFKALLDEVPREILIKRARAPIAKAKEVPVLVQNPWDVIETGFREPAVSDGAATDSVDKASEKGVNISADVRRMWWRKHIICTGRRTFGDPWGDRPRREVGCSNDGQ